MVYWLRTRRLDDWSLAGIAAFRLTHKRLSCFYPPSWGVGLSLLKEATNRKPSSLSSAKADVYKFARILP